MKLEEIGFYTLSDARVKQVEPTTSPLWRCEVILTDKCNFKCPYCRGLRQDIQGTLQFGDLLKTLGLWGLHNLKNVRLSGGEPTTYKDLKLAVQICKNLGMERIAISTNGSASREYYKELIDLGVNDFSISLDACCSSEGAKMAGRTDNVWETVVNNIKFIAKHTYVTLGMVFTDDNIAQAVETIKFGHSLGVADIRIISSAQYNEAIDINSIPQEILNAHPILNYRVNHFKIGRNVRGIKKLDSHRCGLVLDDMAVAGKYHFPCIIYMREKGNPIGEVGPNMREERYEWFKNHDTHKDPICAKNCLDVCVDYNNKYRDYHGIC